MSKPIYLSGAVRPELHNREGRGFIVTPNMGNRPLPVGQVWGADNGCFTRGGRFDEGRYFSWLQARDPRSCLFATAPDVVGDAASTLTRSELVLPKLRELGYSQGKLVHTGEWKNSEAIYRFEDGPSSWSAWSWSASAKGAADAVRQAERVIAFQRAKAEARGGFVYREVKIVPVDAPAVCPRCQDSACEIKSEACGS